MVELKLIRMETSDRKNNEVNVGMDEVKKGKKMHTSNQTFILAYNHSAKNFSTSYMPITFLNNMKRDGRTYFGVYYYSLYLLLDTEGPSH